ncbi:hypothetical protein RB595_000250 [Gaeumannomyces hyphopodioides]
MSPVLALAHKLTDIEPGPFGEGIWAVISGWLSMMWEGFKEWTHQPHSWLMWVVISWVITFTLVSLILWTLGFGPLGVGIGSLAAGFQSWAYGAFTPAGGLFALFTSMTMLGTLNPLFGLIAAAVATFVAVIVGVCRWSA